MLNKSFRRLQQSLLRRAVAAQQITKPDFLIASLLKSRLAPAFKLLVRRRAFRVAGARGVAREF